MIGHAKTAGRVFIIIPALNEEENIGSVLEGMKGLGYDIAVVDDGSTDATAQIALEKGAFVLKHPINRGQGAALQTGNEYALRSGARIIVHFDADGQFVPNEITDLISPIENGDADMVLGSRFLSKKSKIPTFKNYFIFPLARMINSVLFGIKLTDPQSGFRALSSDAARGISIENDGMAHCSEILIKAFSANLKVKEVPTSVIYDDFGQKLSGGARILFDLFLMKLSK